MEPNKEVQSEDTHTVDELRKEVIAPKEEPKPSKSFGAKVLPWFITILVMLIGGAALVFFLLYQPKVAALNADLRSAQDAAAAASQKLSTAETDLALAQSNLDTANTTIDDLTTQLTASQQFSLIYKFQADVNAARVALLKLDPATSLQALNFIKVDLTDLEKTNLDANAIAGFKERIAEAETNLQSDPAKSLEALDTLYNNLLFLISNLQK
jgi:chromosome segregation ATPase